MPDSMTPERKMEREALRPWRDLCWAAKAGRVTAILFLVANFIAGVLGWMIIASLVLGFGHMRITGPGDHSVQFGDHIKQGGEGE